MGWGGLWSWVCVGLMCCLFCFCCVGSSEEVLEESGVGVEVVE